MIEITKKDVIKLRQASEHISIYPYKIKSGITYTDWENKTPVEVRKNGTTYVWIEFFQKTNYIPDFGEYRELLREGLIENPFLQASYIRS